MAEQLKTLNHLADLEEMAASEPGLHVRYSEGPDNDASGGSTDTESGLELPGLSVNPLNPESWWTRPLGDWIARQLCQYKHLQEKNPERFAWVLRGRQVGRGPDCEPLLVDISPIARLSPALLAEAERRYRENFDAGQGPEDGC
ncbi:DUF6098 family protein [Corynebacterium halotolerans]|uniref:Uncharacterized protein n=1 Tax=Corynebacterium halotolerans YIM 70093 = DSM 44683 TaxID=1121362 RepID=M1P806_9CORY|nr:DUF6098 family protein [Corynebacterium halotolerans]AGF72801.1 hypothetical protein A605_08995 [Corynebacterium halotolerans YIM 70093 = DSM 44683]